MDKMAEILFFFSVSLLFGIGVFMVVGTLRGIKVLIDPPVKWYSFYPYFFLKKMGERSIYYFHISIGIVFMLGAIYLFLYVIFY